MKTHKLRRILSLLLAVVMMVNVLPISSIAETVTAGGTDYTLIGTNTSSLSLSNISIKTGSGGEFSDSDSVTDDYQLTISFSFSIRDVASNINESDRGQVTGVTVYRTEVDLQNITFTSSDWQEFSYRTINGYWRVVTENGKTYFDVIVTSRNNTNNVSGTMSVKASVAADEFSDDDINNGTITLKFDNAEEIVKYNNPGSLTVNKAASGDPVYDSTGDTYTQTWIVTLTSSSNGYVILESFADTSNVASTLSGDITIGYPDGSTTTVSDFNAVISDGELLSDGEAITITYSTTFSASNVSNWLSEGEWNYVTNKATVTYNDDKESSGSANMNVSAPSVDKSSSWNSSTGEITYTIKLYWDGFSGDSVTDSQYVTEMKDTVTMSAVSSFSDSISIPDLDDSSWTWTAATSWSDGYWTYTYKYTPSDEQLVYVSNYTNTFEVTIDGETVKDNTTLYNIYYDYIDKSGTKVDSENTILWTITFRAPYNGFDLSGLTIYDSWSNSSMEYVDGTASATLSQSNTSSNLIVSTTNGSSFTFSGSASTLSKGDTITLTYKTTVADPSASTSTISYTNTAKPYFEVPSFPEEPSQTGTDTVDVDSSSDDILQKVAYNGGYNYDDYIRFYLVINTSNISPTQTITVVDQLSIPSNTNGLDGDTNYLYLAWQKYVAVYGEDYSGAFALDSVSVDYGTLSDGYNVSSTGEITFEITNVPANTSSIKVTYNIVFTSNFKRYLREVYADAINAVSWANPGFFVSNTATAYVDGNKRNTDDATGGTYYDYVAVDYIEKSGNYKASDDDYTDIGVYDYVSVEGDTIIYTLTINGDGETLNNGEPLTITDELGSGLALWSASAVANGKKITDYTYVNYYGLVQSQWDPSQYYNDTTTATASKSNVIVLEQVGSYDQYNSGQYKGIYGELERGTDYTVSYDYDAHVITFTIPDSTPVIIVYYCEVLLDNGAYTTGELGNTVEVSGSNSESIDTSEETYTVSYKLTSSLTGDEVTLNINKVDSESGNAIYGATFTVTEVNEYGNPTNTTSQQLTVDQGNNTVVVNYDTIYRIEEISAPDGYEADGSVYYVYLQNSSVPTVDSINGVAITVIAGGSSDVSEISKLKLSAVEGAELTITTTDGSLSADNFESDYNIDVTVTNSQNATVSYPGTFTGISGTHYWWVNLTGLPAGTYIVTYKTDKAVVTVNEDGTFDADTSSSGTYIQSAVSTNYFSATIQIENSPSNSLTINKYATGGSTQLSGAEFTLKANTSLESVTANQAFTLSSDNYSLSFTTTTTAIEFYGLPDGSYTLTETAAPSGYKVADPVTFTVSGGKIDGSSTKTITVEDDVDTTQPQTASLTVSKVYTDSDGTALTTGLGDYVATFTLVSTDNTDTYYKTFTITGAGVETFTDLAYNGTYKLTETNGPTGFTADATEIVITIVNGVVNGDSSNTVTVTNKADKVETTSVTVTKSWADDNDRDGIRPDSVTVTLTGSDGNTYTADLSATDDWTYTWTDLPKENGGVEIKYTVAEVDADGIPSVPTGYTDSVKGYEITNTHTIETTSVTVTKKWEDDSDRDKLRPTEVTVSLLADGTIVDTVSVTEADGWTYTWDNLPKNDNGVEIDYTVAEVNENGVSTVPSGYTDYTDSVSVNGYEITNTHEIDRTEVKVTKAWVGDDNNLSARPDEIIVVLTKNGSDSTQTVTLNADNNWTGSFKSLPVNDENGATITYGVREVTTVSDYVSEIAGDAKSGYTITNTYETTQDTTSVTGTKTWVDPTGTIHPDITIELYQDGTKIDAITLSDGTTTYEFENLDKYDLTDGHVYEYTVKEVAVDGYTSKQDGNDFTNTIAQETISVSGTKTWVDPADTIHPDITIELYQDGTYLTSKTLSDGTTIYEFTGLDKYDLTDGHEYKYTVEEVEVSGYTSEQNGYDFTNTIEQDTTSVSGTKTWVDGGLAHDNATEITLTLYRTTANDPTDSDWDEVSATVSWSGNTYTYSNLDKYDLSTGKTYTYKVVESALSDYTSESKQTSTGYDFKNTIAQKTISVSGTKTWIDPTGTIHPDITIELYQDGTYLTSKTLSDGTTIYEFTGLDKYDLTDGHEYKYTVKEEEVSGYTSEQNGYDFTNTIEQDTASVSGTKTWVDGGLAHDNATEITLTLYKTTANDPTDSDWDEVSATVSWSGNTYTYSNLDKYDLSTGKTYTYKVVESELSNYTSVHTETSTGYDFTNTIKQEKVDITGTKTWVDGGLTHDNASEITLTLYRTTADNPTDSDWDEVTATVSWSGNTYTYSNLDKYDLTTGKTYKYKVEETEVSGYTSTPEQTSTGYNFINTIKQVTISVSGTKTWVDPADTTHPDITIELYRDGTYLTSKTLSDGTTIYEFTGLDKYDLTDGHVYEYTVKEAEVSGYTSEPNGYDFTNTIEQDTTSVSGTKTWVDPTGTTHPDITIELYQDGTKINDVTLSDGTTTYEFENLDKYNLTDGHVYEYTVKEVAVDGYTSKQNGYDFTNTIEQDTTSVSGTKTWVDPADTIHPDITIELYQDGTKVDEMALSDGTTTYEFENLDKYNLTDGHVYEYTVKEKEVDGYTSKQDGNDFTNTIAQETISVSGTKTWVDPTGTIHPDITIELYQDGTKIDAITLSDGTTTYEFENLDKYNLTDGHVYEYTVKEEAVDGYTSKQDGNDFTNTIAQETVSVSGTKTWVDPTGTIHPDITIELYQDGTKIDAITLSDGTTTYEFENLDKYDLTDGHVYEYTVKEVAVDGYTSKQDGNDFTNTIAQETISVSGTKTWVDPTGTIHPDITIELYQDGTKIDAITLSDGTTTYEFENLDKYNLTDGHVYEYTVEEVAVDGYTSKQDGNDFTNTQITTEVTVNKIWDDEENQDGLRENYTVTLYKTVNGVETEVDSQTLPADTLTYTWTELPTYETVNGTQYEVSYTVEETGVPSGYKASDPVGDAATGFEITNSHTPYTTDVSVTKSWSDAGDYNGVRPDSITVTLIGSDGKTYTAELTEDNNWEHTFTDLPVYWNEGTEIEYTLEEVEVDGYTSAITGNAESGFTVTNSHTPYVEPSQVYTGIEVTKVWNDDNNADGVRPASVTIALYRDGVATGRTVTLSEANDWTASFTHLPVYRGTAAYSYTVVELNVPAEYTATVTGENGSFTITNTHVPVVEIEEPVESTNTDEEEDGEDPEASETESNPKTGIALSVIPMVIAALAVASAKRR